MRLFDANACVDWVFSSSISEASFLETPVGPVFSGIGLAAPTT